MESWNWLKMFPAIQTQLAYTFSKLAWKPRTFHWIMECSIASVRRDGWRVHLVIRQGRKLVRKNQILLCLLQPVRSYRLGWYLGPAGGVERLGCENPSTSTRTLSTLTLGGEHLEDDESSFEVAIFKGPAESLGAHLEGAAEPLDAILWWLAEPIEAVLWGTAEPLSVSEEHLADSHGIRASADTVLDFPEEA